MTNELEKQFFDTFGIEPKACIASCDKCQHYSYDYCFSGYCTLDSDYDNCGVAEKQYPQISDRILLELMFLITDISTSFALRNIRNVTALKVAILEFFIKKYGSSQNRKILKHQVRTLFEEG